LSMVKKWRGNLSFPLRIGEIVMLDDPR